MLHNTPSNWCGTAVLALAIFSVVPPAAWGQEQQGFAKIGGYAGGSFVPGFTLDGDTFDGFTYYREIDGDEIALLPKLDQQKMFRGILGYRYEKAALELSYERTRHNGIFGEVANSEATFQQLNVDVRCFFLSSARVNRTSWVASAFRGSRSRTAAFWKTSLMLASETAASRVMRSIRRSG